MTVGLDVRGRTALVTGASRGLGAAFAQALLDAGAGTVYAGARDPAKVRNPRQVPVRLDVTSPRDVADAAAACPDVEIVVNNAGAMLATPVLAENSDAALRSELDVNVFGTLAVSRAFAPVLARNGGGVVVNMLSTSSLYVYPFIGTYAASKHAAHAVTDGLRIELRGQGTRVIAVYAGLIDTDMGRALSDGPKTSPQHVALRTVQGIRDGLEHVLADDSAAALWQATRADLLKRHADMQARWNEHTAAAIAPR